MIQPYHFWTYNPKNQSQLTVEIAAHPCTVLFTIAKLWNQPSCTITDEWIKKIWYIYTMEYYSSIKKN
jgi:hypothetical protein